MFFLFVSLFKFSARMNSLFISSFFFSSFLYAVWQDPISAHHAQIIMHADMVDAKMLSDQQRLFERYTGVKGLQFFYLVTSENIAVRYLMKKNGIENAPSFVNGVSMISDSDVLQILSFHESFLHYMTIALNNDYIVKCSVDGFSRDIYSRKEDGNLLVAQLLNVYYYDFYKYIRPLILFPDIFTTRMKRVGSTLNFRCTSEIGYLREGYEQLEFLATMLHDDGMFSNGGKEFHLIYNEKNTHKIIMINEIMSFKRKLEFFSLSFIAGLRNKVTSRPSERLHHDFNTAFYSLEKLIQLHKQNSMWQLLEAEGFCPQIITNFSNIEASQEEICSAEKDFTSSSTKLAIKPSVPFKDKKASKKKPNVVNIEKPDASRSSVNDNKRNSGRVADIYNSKSFPVSVSNVDEESDKRNNGDMNHQSDFGHKKPGLIDISKVQNDQSLKKPQGKGKRPKLYQKTQDRGSRFLYSRQKKVCSLEAFKERFKKIKSRWNIQAGGEYTGVQAINQSLFASKKKHAVLNQYQESDTNKESLVLNWNELDELFPRDLRTKPSLLEYSRNHSKEEFTNVREQAYKTRYEKMRHIAEEIKQHKKNFKRKLTKISEEGNDNDGHEKTLTKKVDAETITKSADELQQEDPLELESSNNENVSRIKSEPKFSFGMDVVNKEEENIINELNGFISNDNLDIKTTIPNKPIYLTARISNTIKKQRCKKKVNRSSSSKTNIMSEEQINNYKKSNNQAYLKFIQKGSEHKWGKEITIKGGQVKIYKKNEDGTFFEDDECKSVNKIANDKTVFKDKGMIHETAMFLRGNKEIAFTAAVSFCISSSISYCLAYNVSLSTLAKLIVVTCGAYSAPLETILSVVLAMLPVVAIAEFFIWSGKKKKTKRVKKVIRFIFYLGGLLGSTNPKYRIYAGTIYNDNTNTNLTHNLGFICHEKYQYSYRFRQDGGSFNKELDERQKECEDAFPEFLWVFDEQSDLEQQYVTGGNDHIQHGSFRISSDNWKDSHKACLCNNMMNMIDEANRQNKDAYCSAESLKYLMPFILKVDRSKEKPCIAIDKQVFYATSKFMCRRYTSNHPLYSLLKKPQIDSYGDSDKWIEKNPENVQMGVTIKKMVSSGNVILIHDPCAYYASDNLEYVDMFNKCLPINQEKIDLSVLENKDNTLLLQADVIGNSPAEHCDGGKYIFPMDVQPLRFKKFKNGNPSMTIPKTDGLYIVRCSVFNVTRDDGSYDPNIKTIVTNLVYLLDGQAYFQTYYRDQLDISKEGF